MEGFRGGKTPNKAGQVVNPFEAPFDSYSVVDGIIEAKKEAEKQAIRANCVLISDRYVKVKEHLSMFVKDPTECCGIFPAMICGLAAAFTDELPEEFAFAVLNTPLDIRSEYDKLKAENEALKNQLNEIKNILGLGGTEQ